MDNSPSHSPSENETGPDGNRATDDLSIVPDRVSPAVEGYFRIPAIWVGYKPDDASVRVLNPPVHHARVLKKSLNCGIIAHVLRDGTFLFDFSGWPPAPLVKIPGYHSRPSQTIPAEHLRAEQLAESHAVLRAQVMNVHQACLTTAEYTVKRRGAMMGLPVTAWNTEKAMTWDTGRAYHDDTEDIHALARNVLNNKDRVSFGHPLARRVIELDVAEHSLVLLDQILVTHSIATIQIIEGAYIAAFRHFEKRLGEAVTLGWTACEQLVSKAWNMLIDDQRAVNAGVQRMPKDRRTKLNGRDYTASVQVEMLELHGRIDHDLYRMLEIARKARNHWAHEMRVPKEGECIICIRAATRLLELTKNIGLSFSFAGRGGVPQWPLSWWEEVKDR